MITHAIVIALKVLICFALLIKFVIGIFSTGELNFKESIPFGLQQLVIAIGFIAVVLI